MRLVRARARARTRILVESRQLAAWRVTAGGSAQCVQLTARVIAFLHSGRSYVLTAHGRCSQDIACAVHERSLRSCNFDAYQWPSGGAIAGSIGRETTGSCRAQSG